MRTTGNCAGRRKKTLLEEGRLGMLELDQKTRRDELQALAALLGFAKRNAIELGDDALAQAIGRAENMASERLDGL